MLNKVASDHSHHSLGSFPRDLGRGDVLRDLCNWQNNFASHATHLSGGKTILRGFIPPPQKKWYQLKNMIQTPLKGKFDGEGGVHIRWQIWTGGGGRTSKIRCNTGTDLEANDIE